VTGGASGIGRGDGAAGNGRARVPALRWADRTEGERGPAPSP